MKEKVIQGKPYAWMVMAAAMVLPAAMLSADGAFACDSPKPFPEFAKPRAVTRGPHDHFLASYFAINSWSPDNRYILALETDIKDRLPDGAPCTVGLVDTGDGDRFIPVMETRTWNFQEAAMAHWLPIEKDTFVVNDMRDGKFVAVVRNWRTGAERIVPHPVSAVSEDGTWALSINYARLYLTRPDYGYAGEGQDPRRGVVFPEDDGLWRVDLKTGESKLIVSCAAVKGMVPQVSDTGLSYICHTVISKDMKRVYFLSRSVSQSMEGVKKFKGVNWHTTAFTCNADGSDLRPCFREPWGQAHSHFNWKPALSERDARTMVVTCKWQDRAWTHVEFTVGEYGSARQLGGMEMDFDGHCIYSPDGNFVSGDGYWDESFFRHWKMVRLSDGAVKDLGEFHVPERYRDVYSRCDLHPRWRPDGMQLGFNSVHEGTRQIYVMDAVRNAPGRRPALVPAPRRSEWRAGFCPKGAHVSKSTDSSVPPEGYRLEISPKGVAVASSDAAGAFYAERTLAQFGDGPLPCCLIEDAPKYRWRGYLVDEGRHFFGKGEIKRLIDVMADYKYNVFHWHLTEDQGWRLAVDKWPRLAEVGSVRRSSPPPGEEKGYDNERYGPYFYTKEEIREIVAYARERHLEIVPEIDFPGHVMSALAAYPELSCAGGPFETGTQWGVYEDILCAGNDRAMEFLRDVMDEVCDVFPSKVIHLGGDEAPRVRWKRCPKCQARVKALGLKDANALQGWMFREVQRHLKSKGRRAMGWEVKYDGMELGLGVKAEFGCTTLPKDAIVHCWRGDDLVTSGYDVVMSPYMETYYTLPIGLREPDPFPYRQWTKGQKLDLKTCYLFSPMAGVQEAFRKNVLGGEACAWTESTHNRAELEWKMFPRALAHAEALWTDSPNRDFADFARRAGQHRVRLLERGVNCSPLGLESLDAPCAAAGEQLANATEVDPAEFGFASDAEPAANAAALQKALDGGGRTVRISRPGEYRLDRTVFIDDNTTLDCAKGVVLRKVGRYPQILLNRGAFNYTTNVNIVIKGLRVKANEHDMVQPPDSPCPGLRGQIGFVRVRNLAIRDFTCTDYGMNEHGAWRPFAAGKEVGGSQYCIQIAGFDNVLVDGFDIQGGKDGIHLNYGRNFVIRNGRLCTYDDGIALNAGDWPGGATPLMGSLEDGLVENIEDLPGAACNFARVITGCWKDWEKGMKLQRNDMVRVGKEIYCVYPMPFEVNPDGTIGEHESNFAPSHRHGVWKSPDGISFLHLQGDGNVRADIRNVTFRNIRLNSRRGINNGWEINKWARMIHPDIPETDWPVIDISIENVVATTEFPVVDGFANAKVLMRNVRSKGPLYQERFRDDKNSVIRKGMYYRTQVDLTVEDCEFSDEVRKTQDFRFTDAKGIVRLKLKNNTIRRPLRIENKTVDFVVAGI